MPWYEGEHSASVEASPEHCFATLTDYERFPEWQGALRRCEVLEREESGLGSLVDYEVATPIRPVSYSLRHSYEEPSRIRGELVEGQVKGFEGEWRLDGDGAITRVEFALRIDAGFWVPTKVTEMLHDTVMKRAVRDLKSRVDAPARAAW